MSMRKFAFALFVSVFAGSAAFAQSSRVWVSGVGDDVNPCSRTAPCKTFAVALSKVADGGEIDALDAGGYGAVNINKSVTIDGGGTFASILHGGVSGIIINATDTATVTLRNLSINGVGTGPLTAGVRIQYAGRVILENVVIANDLSGSGLGVEVASATSVALINCSITLANGAGIYSHPPDVVTAKITLDHCRIDSTATAISLVQNTKVAVFASSLTHNGLAVYMADATSSVHIHSSTVSENQMVTNVAGPVTFFGSQVFGNDLAFAVGAGGQVRTHGNNAIVGNTDPGVAPVAVGLQ